MDANENLNLHSRLLASIRGLKFNSQSLSLGFSLGSVIKNGGVQREVSKMPFGYHPLKTSSKVAISESVCFF